MSDCARGGGGPFQQRSNCRIARERKPTLPFGGIQITVSIVSIFLFLFQTDRWACKSEQGKFAALASMGGTFGTVFIYPVCGFILKYYSWQVKNQFIYIFKIWEI